MTHRIDLGTFRKPRSTDAINADFMKSQADNVAANAWITAVICAALAGAIAVAWSTRMVPHSEGQVKMVQEATVKW